MPGKSRHQKDKRLLRSKAGNRLSSTAAPSVPAQTNEPVVRMQVAAASAKIPTKTARPSAVSSLHVNREIRTIALLASFMLVLLIAAAFMAR